MARKKQYSKNLKKEKAMPKITTADISQLIQSEISSKTEKTLNDMLDLIEKHGVCYIRFTLEDGMVIIAPRYNSKINGVIADA
jgi:ABC-type antimicrobial peptide transport system ATPase subunit